jgi:S-DNA-T family DNA segregation ATPase FtsK/SpoIIIE
VTADPDDIDHDDREDGEALPAIDGIVVAHPVTNAPRPWQLPRRPVLPTWATDPATAKAAAVWALQYAAHTTAYHALRLPLYWVRLALHSPRGAVRLVCAGARWTVDADSRPVRRALAAAADRTSYGVDDAKTYVKLEEQRRSLVRQRLVIAAVVLCFGAIIAAGTWEGSSSLSRVLLVLAVTAGLGRYGRPRDLPVLSRSVDSASVPRLTSEVILTALGALGIAELNKNLRNGPDAVRFVSPICRDGAGFRAEMDLPAGVTAGDIAERRDRLASGLRRPIGCVWPEGDPESHAGRLVLWVADKPMHKAKPVPWPLAKRGSVNVFEPFPFGTDPRGRTVPLTVMFASGVVGAVPRVGKTFSVRLIALACSLDPRCELHLFDLKGGADWLPLEPVAHAFRVGDDPEDIAYVLRDARALRADMSARYKTIRGLPREVCPEGKVTDALASDRRLGLHPVLWIADECQALYTHPDHGKELAEIVTDLAKRGPAVGIMAWNATQRPSSDAMPTGLTAVSVLRYCLKVTGQVENDIILGTSAYKSGVRATMFTRADKGVGYLVGEGDDPQIVHTAYVDGPGAEAIAARARAGRVAVGRLTGHAAGIELHDEQCTESVLDHLASAWPSAGDGTPDGRAWCETLAERLAVHKPDLYEGWTAEQIAPALRPHGIGTRNVKRGGTVRKGVARSDLLRALAARGDTTDQSPVQPTHDGADGRDATPAINADGGRKAPAAG